MINIFSLESLDLFDTPFDRLMVLSNVEGLTALSTIEGLRTLDHFLPTIQEKNHRF